MLETWHRYYYSTNVEKIDVPRPLLTTKKMCLNNQYSKKGELG